MLRGTARIAQCPPSTTARRRGRFEPGHSDSTSQAPKPLGCTACRPQCSPRASTKHTWVFQDSGSQEMRRRMRSSNKVTRVSDQVREALTSWGPPWAAASTGEEEWCPALPGQAHGWVPRPKVTSPYYPGSLPCLTRFPEFHWSQGRSHAGVKGHEEDSAPLDPRALKGRGPRAASSGAAGGAK